MDGDNDEEARPQADLARAIESSKLDLSPAASITFLSSDPGQIMALESSPPPSAVTAQSKSSFLMERAQLEQERFTRLK